MLDDSVYSNIFITKLLDFSLLETNKKSPKVVFISGIFNVLHPGHIRLFKMASELGQKVVVGVFKKSQAGSHILGDDDRIMALKSISLVDEVTLVDDLVQTLEKIKPDIVVKGHEFKHRYNIEQDIVSKWQGKLIFNSGESLSGAVNYIPNGKQYYSPVFTDAFRKFAGRHKVACSNLIQLIGETKSLRVAVVGDIIVDEYVECDPVGLSREDPTIVVKPTNTKQFVGGAAIVALHAKSFGCHVDFFSICGEDEQGAWVKEQVKQHGIGEYLIVDNSRPTTSKRRYRSQNKTLLRVNNFRGHSLEPQLFTQFVELFESQIANYDVVIFSDFSYGLLNGDMVANLMDIARKQNVFVAADSQTSSQRGDLSKFTSLDLVTPTELEARLAVGIMDNDVGLAEIIENVSQRLNVKNVLITLGAEGTLILDATEPKHHLDSLPALNKNPLDVAGAGDLTLVCSALLLKAGATLWQASFVAMVASAIHVSCLGNTPNDVERLMQSLESL